MATQTTPAYNLSQIMKNAWSYYRFSCQRSGKPFAVALKWAWDQARKVRVTIGTQVRDNEFRGYWAAEITGTCAEYGLKREFVSVREQESRRYFTITADLFPGRVYQMKEAHAERFVIVQAGQIVEISKQQAIANLK